MEEQQPPALLKQRRCTWCGASVDQTTRFCPNCGHPGPETVAGYEDFGYIGRRRSGSLVLGGVMILISGLAGLVGGVVIVVLAGELRSFGFIGSDLIEACGWLDLLASSVPVLGGMYTISGKHFALGLTGGIIGIVVCVFMWGLLGLIPGLVGVILVAICKDEFMS